MDKETLIRLWYAQNSMGYIEFYECFHTEDENIHDKYGMSYHLWNKFKGYNYNLLTLSRGLDSTNMAKLIAYLNSAEFDYNFKKAMR